PLDLEPDIAFEFTTAVAVDVEAVVGGDEAGELVGEFVGDAAAELQHGSFRLDVDRIGVEPGGVFRVEGVPEIGLQVRLELAGGRLESTLQARADAAEQAVVGVEANGRQRVVL